MGLRHTHANNLVDRCTQESVSRTRLQEIGCAGWDTQSKNCDVNGDYLCDTQSDPDLSNYSQNSCSYYGLGNDFWGDPFQTDATNIMSYAIRSCRTSLTVSQIAIMNDNLPSGTNTFGPSYNISGPNIMCSGQSGTFSISPLISGANSYSWSVPPGWTLISGQGSSTVSLFASNNNGGTISVVPGCGSVRQTKVVYPPITSMNISGQTQLCPNSTYFFSVQDSPGLTYTWTVQGNASISSGQGQSGILLFTNSTFSGGQISVSTNNYCTSATVMTSQTLQPNYSCRSKGRIAFQENIINNTESQIHIYPNPVKSSLYLIDSKSEFSNINIYDLKGNKLNLPFDKVSDQKIIIDTSRLQSGTYVIESQNTTEKNSKRFIVE